MGIDDTTRKQLALHELRRGVSYERMTTGPLGGKKRPAVTEATRCLVARRNRWYLLRQSLLHQRLESS